MAKHLKSRRRRVALITIGSGILLLLVGIAGFVLPETKSWTALIPAALGVVFVVLGAFAFNVAMRKHTMHLAAALGLLGFLTSGWRLVDSWLKGPIQDSPSAPYLAVMSLICLIFVGLCVHSFMAARRRRAAVDETRPV
jgi:hypothetical protein